MQHQKEKETRKEGNPKERRKQGKKPSNRE